MGYARVIQYGQLVDVFRYDGYPKLRKVVKSLQEFGDVSYSSEVRQDDVKPEKRQIVRSKESIRRAVVSFRRLIGANLVGVDHPIFASFTYRENVGDIGRARKDFNAFARRMKKLYGKQVRYVSVFEYQERGAIHFHTLFWGIPASVVVEERSSRVVAALWGHGFVDLIATDGNVKLAGYLAKYMGKTFADSRLAGRKCYVTSTNILRPIDDKDAIISVYFQDNCVPNLSGALLVREAEYDTQWLGRAVYKQYQII